MPITGGLKILKRSKALFEDGVTMAATSGTGSESRALDRNRFTFWRSVGSSDSVTETLILTFPSTTTIDRIFLVDHNWKSFTVKYDSGGVFVDFTSVVGLDGALGGGISETTFADNTAYYEFDSVSTTRLEITATLTQTADEDKYLNQLMATEEEGTMVGFPEIKGFTWSRNSRVKKMLSGRSLVQKSEESIKFSLDFKNYPGGTTYNPCLLYTSPSPRDVEESRMPSSA